MRLKQTFVFISVSLSALLVCSTVSSWATYPGTICKTSYPGDYYAQPDGVIINQETTSQYFACPLVTHRDLYYNGSGNQARHSPGDDAVFDDIYVFVDDMNNNSSNGGFSCQVIRNYYLGTSYSQGSSSQTTGSTATGRYQLIWDFDTEFTSTSFAHHYVVECFVPGVDGSMASGVAAIQARYNY